MTKENLGKGMWMGKNLEDMSREELYEAMQTLDELRRQDWKQHEHDLQMLAPNN